MSAPFKLQQDPKSGAPTERDGRARNALVWLSMSLVALALGVGLYVQFGLAFWLALVAALAAYVALISMHVVLRRSERMTDLGAEVQTLQAEIDRLAARTNVPAAATTPSRFGANAHSAAPHANAQSHYAEHDNTCAGLTAVAPTRSAEDSFEHLQQLVKQLASDVAGPKATTPDPDRVRDIDRPYGLAPAQPPISHAAYVDGYGRHDADNADRMRDALAEAEAEVARTAPALAISFRPEDLRGSAVEIAHHTAALPAPLDAGQLKVAEAVAAERLDVLLQPIQALAERKAAHFEVSVRFRDAAGEALSSDEVRRVARSSGLSGAIDAIKLPRVARVAHRVLARGRHADVLTGLDGASLSDQSFLEAFADAFTAADHARIVLSFSQSDVRAFGRFHWETLATMSELGLRFALEEVTDLDLDFEALKVCNFAFVKLDAPVFLDGLPAAGGYIAPEDLTRYFASLDLALVVGRVDSAATLDRVASHGVTLGQGALFGAPKPVRQDVLAAQAA